MNRASVLIIGLPAFDSGYLERMVRELRPDIQVHRVESGDEARKALVSRSLLPSVVLVSLDLGPGEGLEILSLLQQDHYWHSVPAHAVAQARDHSKIWETRGRGARSYLALDDSPTQLRLALSMALNAAQVEIGRGALAGLRRLTGGA